jgi:Flp pilus assembly protein TadG
LGEAGPDPEERHGGNVMQKIHRTAARQDGFALVMTAICIIVLIGMMGLAVDLGRAFIVKNEAQAFTDAAALAAAIQLNGSSKGIANAKLVVSSLASSNKWQFSKNTFSSVLLVYRTRFLGQPF